MSDPPPFERNGCTARRPLFEVTVPKHTRDFPHTNTHTQTHTPTFTLPLDFDPSPSLCISYELSEKTQWIEWQRSKARPCNRPGWRGDGWLCVYDCVGASAYLCVFDSHLLQSRIFRIWICPSWLVFEPGLFSRTSTHGHMHTHTHTLLHSSSLWRRTGSSDRFLISADPKMPWSWYAETCPHPPIWSTHWPEKGVTHMRKRMGSLFWGFIKWMGFFFCC